MRFMGLLISARQRLSMARDRTGDRILSRHFGPSQEAGRELQDVSLRHCRISLRGAQWPDEGWDQGKRTEINPFEVQQSFTKNKLFRDKREKKDHTKYKN